MERPAQQLVFPTSTRWLWAYLAAYLALAGVFAYQFRIFLTGRAPISMIGWQMVVIPVAVVVLGMVSVLLLFIKSRRVSGFSISAAGFTCLRGRTSMTISWDVLTYVAPQNPHYFFARALVSDGRRFIYIERLLVPDFEKLCAILRGQTERSKQVLIMR